MKKHNILLLAASLIFGSCQPISIFEGKANFQMSVSIEGLDTKATTPGLNELNENLISSLDVFFYKSGASDAKVYKRLSLPAGTQLTTSMNIHLTSEEVTALGSGFGIYAIANMPEGVSIDGNETIEELNSKGITVSKPFNQKQDSFVMTGSATAQSQGEGFAANVTLSRVACKLGITIKANTEFTGSIDSASGPWQPQISEATVALYGSVPKGTIGGTYKRDTVNFTSPKGTYNSTRQVVEAVYYSYPSNPLPEMKPYYIITLPWKNDSDVVKTTYYKVFCDYDTFEPNAFYDLTVDITKVGSLEMPKPVTLGDADYKYIVAPGLTARYREVITTPRQSSRMPDIW